MNETNRRLAEIAGWTEIKQAQFHDPSNLRNRLTGIKNGERTYTPNYDDLNELVRLAETLFHKIVIDFLPGNAPEYQYAIACFSDSRDFSGLGASLNDALAKAILEAA